MGEKAFSFCDAKKQHNRIIRSLPATVVVVVVNDGDDSE